MTKPMLTLAFALAVAGTPALARCIADQDAPGALVRCSGSTEAGYRDRNDQLFVTVRRGASVKAEGAALRIRGTGNYLRNEGAIAGRGAAGDGVQGGAFITVENRGRITAARRGIDAGDEPGVVVRNAGRIDAAGTAIRNGRGRFGLLVNRGTITSATGTGFETGDGADVINRGAIAGAEDGIHVGERAFVHNFGTIRSTRRNADPQDGIDLGSGEIVNMARGRILSDGSAGIDFDASETASVVSNAGLIAGRTGVRAGADGSAGANMAAQTVVNRGRIEGRGGLALDLGAGDDALLAFAGSSLLGGADFGAGDDRFDVLGRFSGAFAGGAILDGGAGGDRVSFGRYGLDDISGLSFAGDVLHLAFGSGTDLFALNLRGWERFSFAGAETTVADLLDGPAAVPLPAGALLLVPALGGLALVRRRRNA